MTRRRIGESGSEKRGELGPAPRRQPDAEDSALFRDAVRGVKPIHAPRHAPDLDKPPPVPVHSLLDTHEALSESLSGAISWEESMESGDELSYLRNGVPRDVLRKLRRGHWVVQDALDLHGFTREQARVLLNEFLVVCRRRGLRCVRIVHGKGLGSPNREPVLRGKVKLWLARQNDVLAYCQAPDHIGGSGATLVLLQG